MRDEYDGLPVSHRLHRSLDPPHHLLRRVAPFLSPSVVSAKAGQVRRHAAEAVFQVSDLGSPRETNTAQIADPNTQHTEKRPQGDTSIIREGWEE